ncbi:hypothetical protein [Flavobacterium sp. PL02]|uniref:hypothetical protein n=1 Tax=Flavobacterium sp. PL02 TaxID=3088354 RepID=UPI002B23716F|nr:hypothetical protein [Flavobacterium sp. PL02]MEA9414094.1 hypothetical protein [Flavobacterium sp. PL02]
MSKVAKFVVIINDNAGWIENQAIKFYSNLFNQSQVLGEKYVEENLSIPKLFKIQNDFSVEMMMVYDNETPLGFMKLNSSRLSNQNLGANKPVGIDHIVYFGKDDLMVLLKRAEKVANQRKYDLIWIKAFKDDVILIELLESLEYQVFDYEEDNSKNSNQEQVYFRKEMSVHSNPIS